MFPFVPRASPGSDPVPRLQRGSSTMKFDVYLDSRLFARDLMLEGRFCKTLTSSGRSKKTAAAACRATLEIIAPGDNLTVRGTACHGTPKSDRRQGPRATGRYQAF